MSYATGTILARNEPKDTPYDRIKVIGPSSIKTTQTGEWEGGSGDSIIVEPLSAFGAPEILPLLTAANEYSIEFEPAPEATHIESQRSAVATRQLTAEEQFRIKAQEEAKEKKRRSKAE